MKKHGLGKYLCMQFVSNSNSTDIYADKIGETMWDY